MSQSAVLNGVTYTIPDVGESLPSVNWGQNLTDYFTAIPNAVLQKTGGNFTLTADVDFGSSYGIKSTYYKSRATNISSVGVGRFGNAELLGWRNQGNTADITLGVDSSNILALVGNTGLAIDSTRRFYFDGGGDTYVAESSANVLRITTGSSVSAEFYSTAIALKGCFVTSQTLSDNVDVTGVTFVRYDGAGIPLTLNGLSSGSSNQTIYIFNIDSSASVTIKHNNAGGTQKFLTPGGTDYVLTARSGVTALFDISGFWVILDK
jgi:hypothetical protein